MATTPTYDFPLKPNSYAAFDSISLRNLIIQRLNDQGIFTDQNYIGSNLSCIIDIISFSFNTLMYYLNKTSNESMFSEAQLYENINRIVKILDYKPIGYQTSCLAFSCSASNAFSAGVYTIPKYSYISIGGITFSFNEDITFSIPTNNVATALTDLTNKKLLMQGTFREHPSYTAVGDSNETVVLNSVTKNNEIDHFNIHVYVYEAVNSRWVEYQDVPNLYTEQALARVFEKRLNSSGLYEIKFGDGVNGRIMQAGDIVSIFYLQSSKTNGIVGPNTLQGASKSLFKNTRFELILRDIQQESLNYITDSQFTQLSFDNPAGSTVPTEKEDAESIRRNAPTAFKSQYRLVTLEDYISFIRTNFNNFISDVKVFNNWDYIGKYFKYFYDLGLNPGGFNQVMLNQVMFADSCNFNNIYVCATPRISQGSTLKYLLPAQKELIISNIAPLKTITTEISFLDPIYKALHFGVKTAEGVIDTATVEDNVLELVRTPGNLRSDTSIIREAAGVFKTHFEPSNLTLGATLKYTSLISKLLEIDGVTRIQTRNSITNQLFEGLSFYLWNPVYPDLDKQTVVNDIILNDFELLYYNRLSTIETKIVVI